MPVSPTSDTPEEQGWAIGVRHQVEERLAAGYLWHNLDFVFCTEVGTPIWPSNLRWALRKATTEAGLGEWSPNGLRHSAVSMLSAAGYRSSALPTRSGTRRPGPHRRSTTTPEPRAEPCPRDGQALSATPETVPA